ncbi:MAG: hypothetical protein WBA22_19570 [Candidatus Methanofastidiosia archaeon]
MTRGRHSFHFPASIGPFTHKPGSLGYQSYSTTPACDQQAYTFYVTTNWKAYPAQVQYDVNGKSRICNGSLPHRKLLYSQSLARARFQTLKIPVTYVR